MKAAIHSSTAKILTILKVFATSLNGSLLDSLPIILHGMKIKTFLCVTLTLLTGLFTTVIYVQCIPIHMMERTLCCARVILDIIN